MEMYPKDAKLDSSSTAHYQPALDQGEIECHSMGAGKNAHQIRQDPVSQQASSLSPEEGYEYALEGVKTSIQARTGREKRK